MNGFDKICAVPAFALGVVFLIFGTFGTFTGVKAHFSLPPLLGVIPAFVGWGILCSIYYAWNADHRNPIGFDELRRVPPREDER